MADPWRPANPVEAALADALAAGDQRRYCAVLAESVVLVPMVKPDGARPVLASARLADGSVVVPAFTSPAAMADPAAASPAQRSVPVPFAQLVAAWPDPAWLLAVNPGLPVAGHLPGAELPAVVREVFEPVNDVERELAGAREPGDTLAALARAELHLPVPRAAGQPADPGDPSFPWWRWDTPAEAAPVVVPAFTSPRRLHGCLGLAHPELESVVVDLLALTEHWPDPRWSLTVNPGAPYTVSFLGAQIQQLAEQLPAAVAYGVLLQMFLPAGGEPPDLDHGIGPVSGLVHRYPAGPAGPGYAIRWRPEREVAQRWVRDATPRFQTVELPAGAELVELRADRTERLIATYHPDRHEWLRPG